MDVRTLDHVNLRIPPDGTEDALAFYRDRLGQPIEGLAAYRDGEQSFFDVRLAPAHVIHLWPTDAFEPPSGHNFTHVALTVDDGIRDLKPSLETAGVGVDREIDAPLGATGRAPAVYVTDPFGYRIELKARE